MNLKKENYWIVLNVRTGTKSVSDALIHMNSVIPYMISESWFDCFKLLFKTPVGKSRPSIFDKNIMIARLSTQSIEDIIWHQANLYADCYDDDRANEAIRGVHAVNQYQKVATSINSLKKYQFVKVR